MVGSDRRDTDRDRLADALRFALEAHAEQRRKGTQIPYVSHLLQVSGLVFEAGGDVDQAIAALLHDTIEDCDDVDAERIEARFGGGVAAIVVACSDVLPGDAGGEGSDWGERKARYLERIASAPTRVRTVVACDKLHNLRCIVGELRAEGLPILEKFNATSTQTRWYYESAHQLLRDALPAPLALEFDDLVESMRGLIPRVDPRETRLR